MSRFEHGHSSSHRSSVRLPRHDLVLYAATCCMLFATTRHILRRSKRGLSFLSRVTDGLLPLVYSGWVPDVLLRLGIRIRLSHHLSLLSKESVEDELNHKMREIVLPLKSMPVAIQTDDANEQHYEVPSRFYDHCLGPHKKYSSGLWPSPATTLEESEAHMMDLCCARMGLENGMRVVDLGCGWGSLSLHILSKYPDCHVTGISNSHSQRDYILRRAQTILHGNVNNLTIITCNLANEQECNRLLEHVTNFDRVASVEMFEHMKNYSLLFANIHKFLTPKTGKLFVHIFTHKQYAYHFESGSWLTDHFFSGGTMPSDDLLLYFSRHFSVSMHWRVNGSHYQRTSNAWLHRLDTNWKNGTLPPVMNDIYGTNKGHEWYMNWRLFFLSCAELWGYRGGEEWIVSHYLLEPR